jgi:branched-chain amino acid transport system permease protein
MKAFIASVVGGVGNIPGALAGGLVLGFGEILLVAAFPRFAAYRDIFSFAILIVMLLVRPTGLLGTPVREEKM